jgi:hypothetical protein
MPEPGEESQNARPDGLTLKSAQKEAAVAAAALAAVGSSDGVIWRPAIAITPAKLSMSLLKIKGLVASFVHCCRQLHSAASLEETLIIPTLARTCFLELCSFVGMMRQQEEEEEDTTQEDGQTRAAMLLVANKQTTEKAHNFGDNNRSLKSSVELSASSANPRSGFENGCVPLLQQANPQVPQRERKFEWRQWWWVDVGSADKRNMAAEEISVCPTEIRV